MEPMPLRAATARGYDWRQFDGNAQHSGTNGWESTITTRNVGRLRRLFRITLPSFIDGAPVYMRAVPTSHGLRDLLFATTYSGAILALDAHTGDMLWGHQNGTRQRCPAPFWKHMHTSEPCYTYSSAAIDPDRRFVYSYGLDGYVHKYAVSNGAEITGQGWPELVTRKPAAEKESSALGVDTARNGSRYLYVTTSSYGDAGDYQGHLTTINLTSGTQHVFNALCSDKVDVHFAAAPSAPDCHVRGAGIWARAGVVYVRETDRIYLTTGNGPFAPARHAWGESVLALHPDGTGVRGTPLDSYTPANYAALNATDHDMGSTAPALVPTLARSRVPPWRAAASGTWLSRGTKTARCAC
jgi:outer membrane protein assembly factor BamB